MRRRRLAPTGPTAALLLGLLPASAVATELPPPEHTVTRELIALVDAAAADLAARGTAAACSDFKTAGSRWLHDDTYVFVFDTAGNTLCHPARPALEGRNLIELRDPDGKPIVAMFLREVAAPATSGWVHYLWPRPGASVLEWKSTYLVRIGEPGGREVIVGSGAYGLPVERFFIVDQVHDAVALIASRGREAFPILRDPASDFRFLDTYVFVMNEGGVQLVNAGFPELEGQNLLDLADANGKLIGQEMLKLLGEQEAGWVDYLWPRPGDTAASPKSTYVARTTLDGERLVVGSGMYLSAAGRATPAPTGEATQPSEPTDPKADDGQR